MAETMMVQVSLIPCTTEIEAKPGDKLMILNGKCVGVYTGENPQPDWPRHEKNAQAGAKGGAARAAKLAQDKPGLTAQRQDYIRRIPEVVRANPGITTKDLLDKLGVSSDESTRWQPRDVAKQLARQGVLRSEPANPGNPKMGSRYWLNDTPA